MGWITFTKTVYYSFDSSKTGLGLGKVGGRLTHLLRNAECRC